jgi:alpha-glucosidase
MRCSGDSDGIAGWYSYFHLSFKPNMKSLQAAFLPWALFLAVLHNSAAQSLSADSPDRKIRVTVHLEGGLAYSLDYLGKPLVHRSAVAMRLSDGATLGGSPKLRQRHYREVRDTILSPVPEKRLHIPDRFNELTVRFREEPYSLIVRVYDDGMAWRFATQYRDSITIAGETASFALRPQDVLYYPQVQPRPHTDVYHTSFEEPYQVRPLDSVPVSALFFNPVLAAPDDAPRLVITESDIEDYPGMFLRALGNGLLRGEFAPYPLEEEITGGEFPQAIVTRRADWIARTAGTRTFPWRVIAVAADDRSLPENDIVYRLASPSRVTDPSWIRPGQATDEWIIGINLFNVPFRAGLNTETYKYYIDFAKRFGLERIMMDAGWSDYQDLFSIHPDIDMEQIAEYARRQGIGLSLWTLAHTLERQLEPALEQFNRWGVDFIMTDFMDRDDQKMMRFYYRIAEAFARKKIMVMYHGGFKPAGFNRTWPHAVTREGVLGSEYNIWSDKADPELNVLQAFIRMVAGPMDYEPGLLQNATRDTFRPIFGNVMSLGSRCHQLAMFAVYDSPIQVFSGNPSTGYQEPEFMELLGSIPTVWDETKVLEAQLGDYLITLRQKGNEWFIGALNDWTARSFNIPLDFLPSGRYEALICEDGINADRYAGDYRLRKIEVDRSGVLSINLAPGGGYLVRLRRR